MKTSGIVALATQLAAADPDACDRRDLAEQLRLVSRLRAWCAAHEARCAHRLNEVADEDGGPTAAAVLTEQTRRAGREAAAVERRGAAMDLMPMLGGALERGEVSAAHVDAVGRAVDGLDDNGRAQLAELDAAITQRARETSVETFERQVRDLARLLQPDHGLSRHEQLRRQRCLRRWVDRATGACHTHLVLDPETDARIAAALDAAIRAEQQHDESVGEHRSFDQLKADAAVALLTGARASDRRVASMSLLVDMRTLIDGLHDASVCETHNGQPLPPETIRRIACDAEIIPIVLGSDGVVLDVGRGRRTATRHQRHALRAMHATCAYPGCTVRFADCDVHHLVPWQRGGRSDMDNLLPLCSTHHHAAHEGGHRIALHADRSVTVTHPNGETLARPEHSPPTAA